MQYIALVFLLLSQSMSQPITGDLEDDFGLLLVKLSNITWQSITDAREFIDSANQSYKIDLIKRTDLFFELFFNKCRDGVESSVQKPDILKKLDQIVSYSSEITAYLTQVIQIKSLHETNASIDAKALLERVIAKYLENDPSREILSIINYGFPPNPFSAYSFMEQYQKLGDICSDRVSQLQRVNTLLQYLQWALLVKLHFIVRPVTMTYEETEAESQESVIKVFLDRYKPFTAANMYYDTIIQFQEEISRDKLAVYRREFLKHDFIESFEILPYKTMFLEDCYSPEAPFMNIRGKVKRECSRIDSAPELCRHRLAGVICPTWFPCNKTSCKSLTENTTVCLDQSTGPRRYEYFIPSNRADTRSCSGEIFELHRKVFSDPEYPYTICNPCMCSCETGDEEYYYSTEPAMSNFTENMVVTGLQLKLQDNTLFIKVQQGRIRPGGVIDPRTLRWLPVNKGAREKISLDKSNSIDLSRVTVPGPNEVITGLSLSRGPSDRDYRIALKAHAHLYDSKKNTLHESMTSYTSAYQSSEMDRAEIVSSSNTESNTIVRNKFISFMPSGGHNGGRTTLPLIDGRRVVPSLPTPLSGAGLYFRKQPRGGLIGLELLTRKVSPLDDFENRWN